jgi:carboxypeptidase T
LTEGYKKDPKITKIVNNYNIWVVPILNVDGLEYTWKVNNMWRKNRKPHRTGAIGVDLNRNYDLDWYKCGGSTAPRSEVVRKRKLIFFSSRGMHHSQKLKVKPLEDFL